MASSPTELYLPQTFPYPIRVISIDAKASSSIQRGTRLLSYSFVYLSALPDAQPETRFGTWDAAIEGAIDRWNIKTSDIISLRRAKEKPVVVVIEPCKHGMQLGGLCVLCGKDMTNTDYTGFSDASRASIQMTHSAFGPTVSLEEAQRIERETADHLLKSRKLSLIVDLDQTIVHATVDPTVGEWITEGEAWEERQAKKASTSKAAEADDSSDSDDECNPNWVALKDVKKFRLGPESFGPLSARGPQKGKGKNKMVENEGCMYYIKPRPGWREFLRETATKYEMHVYTMGTRAYAEEVCAAIDPDGKAFGGRVLSRDESGSLTQKSLQRLFPCDTSMVVIIDDRADVWEWSPNLLKVVPYDFFVGIGDINSTFLPKVEPLTAATSPRPADSEAKEILRQDAADPRKLPLELQTTSPEADPGSTTTPLSTTLPVQLNEEVERAQLAANAMLKQNNLALEAQLEERPLAKKQEALQEGNAVAHEHSQHNAENKPVAGAQTKLKESSPHKHEKRKALLKNDDHELERVAKLLDEVHRRFFSAYDARPSAGTRRKSTVKREVAPYDVTRIIPRIRTEVLEGVHILFSSVIPLDTKPESTEIWRMAHMFGARCSTELTADITHVVAAKRGTVKVDTARKRGGIKIVWLAWFMDCITLWRRQDETPYLLDDPPIVVPSSSPITDSQQISSDPDPDGDDWDQDPGERKEDASLEFGEINWDDINDEVEAAMRESDDDDDETRSGLRSGDEGTDETNSVISANNTPRPKRKRIRSVTPERGTGDNVNGNSRDDDVLRSPLAKRKKLAAERTGLSRLKEAFTADDVQVTKGVRSQGDRVVSSASSAMDEADEDDGDDEEEEEEDDFLARDLQEEWG